KVRFQEIKSHAVHQPRSLVGKAILTASGQALRREGAYWAGWSAQKNQGSASRRKVPAVPPGRSRRPRYVVAGLQRSQSRKARSIAGGWTYNRCLADSGMRERKLISLHIIARSIVRR